MRTKVVFAFLFFAAFVVAHLSEARTSGASGHENVESVPERIIHFNYRFRIRDIPLAAKQIAAWVPVPRSNEHQTLLNFDLKGEWNHRLVSEPEYGNQFIYFDLRAPRDGNDIDISVEFEVKRKSYRKLDEPEETDTISPASLVRYLSSDNLVPIDGKIAEEAQRVAGTAKNPLATARKLYDHIVKTLSYDKSGTGWGRGDAVYACDIRKGNCTDFHSLFIGQARALSIPARFIMGVSLPDGKSEGKIAGYHCWAEFHLEGKGWVPVDASEAYKSPDRKEELFGGLDKNRIQFTTGRDIHVPMSKAGRLNYLIYPYVEIDGETHSSVESEFTFRDLVAQQ